MHQSTKADAPKLPTMHLPRTIRTHECTEADKLLTIHAGHDGPGGAPHQYQIVLPRFYRESPNLESSLTLDIRFQDGPICENGFNGITIESLLAIAHDRLDRFQDGPYQCRENALAGIHILNALQCLHNRTRRRQREHAEGTSAPDSSGVAPVSDRCSESPSPLAGEGRGEGSDQPAGGGTSSSPEAAFFEESVDNFMELLGVTVTRITINTELGRPMAVCHDKSGKPIAAYPVELPAEGAEA